LRYSIDTSSLIEGFRNLYPYEVFPRLWNDYLPSLVERGELRATDEVRVELQRRDDELLQWLSAYADDLFVEIDEDTQREVLAILSDHRELVHVGRGRSGADPFVIALAKLNEATVVTEEGSGSRKKPRIPDVCGALGIRCMKLIHLIQEQGWTFD
jgi:predicted nucleic acid-binding protein